MFGVRTARAWITSSSSSGVAMRWLTSGPAVQSRKTRRKLVVQYGGKREELPIQVDDHEVDLADGTTMRNGIINALGSRFAHISPEQELDLILGTVPSVSICCIFLFLFPLLIFVCLEQLYDCSCTASCSTRELGSTGQCM